MPVPEGVITTSDILTPEPEVVETSTNEYEEALTEAIEEVKEKIDDLPELS